MLTTSRIDALADELAIAYGGLTAALTAALNADEKAYLAREELTKARAAILNATPDPKTLGSNEAAREAKLAELTSESVDVLRTAEREARWQDHQLTLAREQLAHARARLRLAEVAVGMVKNF